MKQLLEERDAAAVLNRAVSTIRGWRQRNVGPPWIIDPMGAIHYDRDVLEAWLLGRAGNSGNKQEGKEG
jgi:hypothetical protein